MATKYTDIGKYNRTRFIARGYFSEVYEARDRALQVNRALKVIKTDNPGMLIEKLREARLQEICKHKHVVEVKDANVYPVDGKLCVVIVTEVFQRGSAQDLLRSGFVSLADSVSIVRDALFGLQHLHNNGVVHCDIKPANILITDRMRAKLSDFGLAVRLKHGDIPAFSYNLHLAPENAGASVKGTVLADVYSMGVTLYRLVNNIVDFGILAPKNLRAQIRRGRFPDRTAYCQYVPRKIRRITNKAMHSHPQSRYQSATDFRQALERVRMGIHWWRLSELEWKGHQGNKQIRLIGGPRRSDWFVEFIQNGRRKTRLCRSGFQSNLAAKAYIEKLVVDTSVE